MSGPASDLLWGQVAEDLKDFLLNLSPDLSLETVAKELAKEFGISDSEAMDLATYGDRLNNTSPQFFSDFAKDLPVSGPHPV